MCWLDIKILYGIKVRRKGERELQIAKMDRDVEKQLPRKYFLGPHSQVMQGDK
jgi:hypothetical protein